MMSQYSRTLFGTKPAWNSSKSVSCIVQPIAAARFSTPSRDFGILVVSYLVHALGTKAALLAA